MANCFIIHGTMGCPDENWFFWAQTEIAKVLNCEKYDVITPHFPYVVGNNEYQGYNLWKSILLTYKNAGLINQDTIFIGHSLGPVFIFRFLEETKTYVKAVISVSGKNNNWLNIKSFDNFNFDFYCNWKQLSNSVQYAKYRYAIYGSNDPYISQLNCKKFASAIQAEEIMIENGGHINAAAGYTKFPLLIDIIKKIMSNEPPTKYITGKNFLDLEEPIEESADLIFNKAKELCGHGVMAEDCTWYHSVWQYLRLMNLVSTPAWHDVFYQKELGSVFASKKRAHVLVSGTADYSMLAYVLYAAKTNKCQVDVDVLDTCKTPLFACEWFAAREGENINTINEDILKFNCNDSYDVICTDAFLTRFDKKTAQAVVDKWYMLLKKGGTIITTVRIYEKAGNISKSELEQSACEFADKARERSSKLQDHIQFSANKIADMAYTYAINMTSNNIGNKDCILSLFDKFEISYYVNNVLGEFKRTKYLEIVATKK